MEKAHPFILSILLVMSTVAGCSSRDRVPVTPRENDVQPTLAAGIELSPTPDPGPNPDETPIPPILDLGHLGWKNQNCHDCHELPIVSHTTAVLWECSACHGGNGAWIPPSLDVDHPHSEGDDCIACHQTAHGFTQNDACTACHYAYAGTVPYEASVPAGGDLGSGPAANLLPASELVTDCLGFPAEAITISNHARPSLGIKEGQPAVDFVLQDLDGILYTLGDLLKDRPVLMVLGGYT